MESRKRSIIKSLTWRIIGLVDLAIEVYILARIFADIIHLVIAIPLAHFTSRFIEYYFHERIWSRIGWGYGNDKN